MVFNETGIFTNVSVRARNFTRRNIEFVLVKGMPILKEVLIVLSSLREKYLRNIRGRKVQYSIAVLWALRSWWEGPAS
jgi:hypothetical protein